MPRDIKSSKSTEKSKRSPAMSAEAQHNRMISLANKCAEEQLRKGTASSQIICHYLKMGSEKERLSIEKEKAELELLRAKTKQIESAERIEALYARALGALSSYKGDSIDEDGDEDEEDIF